MPFVADYLGAWLVGLLTDAGRKKLTALVLGSDQDRALRQAASAAVWVTAEETSAPGSEQAQDRAMVISQVFGEPVPDAPPAGPATLLQELRAGIAAQLAVLDDADPDGRGEIVGRGPGSPGCRAGGQAGRPPRARDQCLPSVKSGGHFGVATAN